MSEAQKIFKLELSEKEHHDSFTILDDNQILVDYKAMTFVISQKEKQYFVDSVYEIVPGFDVMSTAKKILTEGSAEPVFYDADDAVFFKKSAVGIYEESVYMDKECFCKWMAASLMEAKAKTAYPEYFPDKFDVIPNLDKRTVESHYAINNAINHVCVYFNKEFNVSSFESSITKR